MALGAIGEGIDQWAILVYIKYVHPGNASALHASGVFVFSDNWLRVLGTTERSQVDQRVRQQFHPIVPLLDVFKTK